MQKLKKSFKVAWEALPLDDLFTFGGIASAGYGVYQIHEPSAFIAVGVAFIALGYLWR